MSTSAPWFKHERFVSQINISRTPTPGMFFLVSIVGGNIATADPSTPNTQTAVLLVQPTPVPMVVPTGCLLIVFATPEPVSSADPAAHPALTAITAAPSAPVAIPSVLSSAAPEDPPRIFSVELSNATSAGGEIVNGRVVTSTNVATVVARLSGYKIGLSRSDIGVFTVAYTVPRIPFFLRHRYTIEISAVTAAGKTVSVGAPIQLR